jgi:hypothetical protein
MPNKPIRRPVSPHLTVEIHQGAIDNSVRRNANHCMIAEAIHQQLPLAKNIEVDLVTIRWTDPVKRLRYIYFTPKEAQKALIDFDRGVSPSPFQLRLQRAAQIMRGRGRAPVKTEAEQREVHNRNRRLARSMVTTDASQPFAVSTERKEEVIQAMEDPNAALGPATVMYHPRGNMQSSIPVVVGGKPPLPGQLAHKRRFGLRQMIE